MARLEDLLRGLRMEDLPQEYADLAPVLTSLDAALNAIVDAFNGNITLADNVTCERLDVQLTHGVAQPVALKKLRRVGSVIGCSAGLDANGTAHAFAFPPEVKPATAFGMAQVVAYFRDPTAVRVQCSLFVEPGGISTSKLAADGPTWIAPTLLNSWVNYGGIVQSVAYLKDASGFVRLRGTCKSGTVNTPIFTLPANYRPSARAFFAVDSNSAFGELNITTAGDVTLSLGSNVSCSFDGVSFDTRP